MFTFLNSLISAAAGLGGVFVGGWLSDRRERQKQGNDFIRLQLSDFYGPLLSMFTEVRARDALRMKLIQTINQHHGSKTQEIYQRGHDAIRDASMEGLNKLGTMANDEKQIFRDTAMPAYRQMLTTFREKIWLAEPDTRNYFTDFIEFIDVWERTLRDTISPDTVTAIGHNENNLDGFYQHIKSTHDRLRHILVHQGSAQK
jgi:hypothetical protein